MQLCCCISVINKSQTVFISKIKAWQFSETTSGCSFRQEQLLFCWESWISWCPGEFTWQQGVGVNFEMKYDSYVEYDKGRNFWQMNSVTWCSDVFLICCFGQWGGLGLGRHLFIVPFRNVSQLQRGKIWCHLLFLLTSLRLSKQWIRRRFVTLVTSCVQWELACFALGFFFG